MQSLSSVYVTYDIHDSRLVDKSNFSRDAFPSGEKIFSVGRELSGKFKIQRKETLEQIAVAKRVRSS